MTPLEQLTSAKARTFPVVEVFGPTPKRIVEKVAVGEPEDCWPWLGAFNGYPMVWNHGTTTTAHRVIWGYINGDPGYLQVDHLCRNTICCNPAHLEAVTPKVNTLRSENPAAKNAIKTECVHGHTLADSYRRPDGRRRCRSCEQNRSREYQRSRRGGDAI